MCYVCDVLYAVVCFRVNCFVVRGCAVSRKYINNVCNSYVFSVVNMCLDVCLCLGCGGVCGEWVGSLDKGFEGWGGRVVLCPCEW